MTVNSKEIKMKVNSTIKCFVDEQDSDSAELKTWEKVVRKLSGKISKLLSKLPLIWRYTDLLDDLEIFPIRTALKFFFKRWFRILTFHQFRYHFGIGVAYFKRGFKSHDFDSFHALDDLCWKLKRLADVLEDQDLHYGDDENAKQIREAVRLFKRVQDDEYIEEFEKQVTEKYGDNIHYRADTEGIFGFMNEGKGPFKNSKFGAVSFNRREKWTPELDKEIRKAERAMYKKAANKRQKEWKKALSILEEHFFRWWN